MALPKPYPLAAREFEKIWGSTQVEPWFPATERKIGEIWFAEQDSPVLVKFLFTTENLSVQVHPGGERGKTEMWHILRAEPGAKIALGLTRALTADQLRQASVDGSIMERLRWIPASAGDTWFVPAGAVHAIGAGIALCEIQQHSDTTFRLFDYGRDRDLHLDDGIAASNTAFRAEEIAHDKYRLVDCPYFAVDYLQFDGDVVLGPGTAKDQLLVACEGGGSIGGEPFRLGQVWKLPPGEEVTLTGKASLLRVSY